MERGIDICSTVKDLVKVNVVYIQRNVKKVIRPTQFPKFDQIFEFILNFLLSQAEKFLTLPHRLLEAFEIKIAFS